MKALNFNRPSLVEQPFATSAKMVGLAVGGILILSLISLLVGTPGSGYLSEGIVKFVNYVAFTAMIEPSFSWGYSLFDLITALGSIVLTLFVAVLLMKLLAKRTLNRGPLGNNNSKLSQGINLSYLTALGCFLGAVSFCMLVVIHTLILGTEYQRIVDRPQIQNLNTREYLRSEYGIETKKVELSKMRIGHPMNYQCRGTAELVDGRILDITYHHADTGYSVALNQP